MVSSNTSLAAGEPFVGFQYIGCRNLGLPGVCSGLKPEWGQAGCQAACDVSFWCKADVAVL